MDLKEQHRKCLYPEVQVCTNAGLGSGTVIFCEPTPGEADSFDTYVLTNEHVVDSLISIEKRWNAVLKKESKEEVLGHPDIKVFQFAYTSRVIGGTTYQADIVAYDKQEDLALLRVRCPQEFRYVATIYPEAKVKDLVSFMPVWNVGCGLGGPPAITPGYLSAFGIDIENRDYMLVTAPSIFGNSGGATFLQESGEFIGIPARISVKMLGWSVDVITHLGFSIPVARVHQFLKDQIFDFIIDPQRTSAQCDRERQERRERDLRKRVGEDEEDEGENINPRGAGVPYYD